jgi:hypothetical protein
MKKWLLLILVGYYPVSALGQLKSAEDPRLNSAQREVMAVIDQLFEAMRTNDGPLAGSLFTENAQLYTSTYTKDGIPVLLKEEIASFVQMIGQPKKVMLSEPIWAWEVRMDGPLAQVWTKYAFYIDDRFSHCGVDAFHLHKSEDGWKIFHITDTRQTQNCQVPESIKSQKR